MNENAMIMNQMINELKNGKNIMDLVNHEDYKDFDKACAYHVGAMDETRKETAVNLARMMGMSGLWRGVWIAITVADYGMNHANILFSK